jgi:hypothetical protein
MYNENIDAAVTLVIELRDEFGEIKETRDISNLVTNLGMAFIASRMKDAAAAAMTHMAIGTGATAAAVTQTTLVTENARVALTSSNLVTTNVANDALQFVATFGAGVGTGAIVEAGLLNAVTLGTMLSRTVFSVINKGALDTLTITWKITIQ